MFFKKEKPVPSPAIEEIEDEDKQINKKFRVLETRGKFIPQTKVGSDWGGIHRQTVEYTISTMSGMLDSCSYDTYEEANNRVEEYLTLRVEIIHPVKISPKAWRILKSQ